MASDKVIINAGMGHWYPKGARRLKRSLSTTYDGELLQWIDVFPNDDYEGRSIYTIKASAMEVALQKGYDKILWLDCSIWATKDVTPVFDMIHEHGYYAINNGYNLAQTVSDRCLEYFGITRDEAEKMPECASGIMGINTNKETGIMLANMFVKACKEGAADGSREHNGQSNDKRFLFHRQDQSVWSCCLAKLGLAPNDTFGKIISYNGSDNDSIFLINGM